MDDPAARGLRALVSDCGKTKRGQPMDFFDHTRRRIGNYRDTGACHADLVILLSLAAFRQHQPGSPLCHDEGYYEADELEFNSL